MEWTREKRYLPYSKWDAETLLDLERSASSSKYQLHYHIHPLSGLLNDPNGFSYFNNEWHVFYQSYPFGAVHGLKSWVHLTSPDLVSWKNLGLTVKPDTPLDSHGAYSGSAREIDGKLFLMYTGNVRDKDWKRTSYQVGAFLDKNNKLTKIKKPLIEAPDHVTEHFRDPQILEHEGKYYAILGAQDKEKRVGKISLYRAENIEGPWKDLGYVDLPDMGYMIECPNLVFISGKPVFIFCPQGLDKKITDYQNIYPNMYWIGESFDFDSGHFETKQKAPINLDEGFDVYATQAFNAPNGKAYAISWVGLPDDTYPTDEEGWANCLSQVKELSLKDGKLVQKPVKDMKKLRESKEKVENYKFKAEKQYELKLTIEKNQKGNIYLAANEDCTQGLKLTFNTGDNAKLALDRGNSGEPVNEDSGVSRNISLPENKKLKLHIFIDHSLIEVFVNGGEKVITGRFFAPNENIFVKIDRYIKFKGSYYVLRDM